MNALLACCFMNAKTLAGNRRRTCRSQLLTTGTILLLILPLDVQAGGVVTTCTDAALRAAMAGGGTVTFACDGTIMLARPITNDVNLTLDGSGHQVTISGSNVVRVFFVNTNVTVTMMNLTIANGKAGYGGGLFNNGGTVELDHCVVAGNWAQFNPGAPGGDGHGGGVYNLSGALNATHCTFSDNRAYGASPGADEGCWAYGGAIYNGYDGAVVNVSQCTFLRNQAVGGNGAAGSDGSVLSSPGNGRPGGTGLGGAVYNLGTLIIDRSLFASNNATGGAGGRGGDGGYVYYYLGANQSGGAGANGGGGFGGDIFNAATATVANCTFAWNAGTGFNGGRGGVAASSRILI